MTTAFKSLLCDSNASLKLVEQDKLNIKVFEINMAAKIYPLYNYLVNTQKFSQSSVIGTWDVPTEVPLQPGDGPVL